jgi:predicted metalloenzyme YecM
MNIEKKSEKNIFEYKAQIEKIIGDYMTFIKNVNKELEEYTETIKLDLSNLNLLVEHINYRCETEIEYNKIENKLKKMNAILLNSTLIGGRIISVWQFELNFKDNDTLTFNQLPIVLELIAPKQNNKYTSGLQTLAYVCKLNRQELVELGNSNPAFELSGLQNEHNPHLELPLPSGNAIKIHIVTLPKAIELQTK